MNKSNTKNMILSAVMIALGVVIPMAFHAMPDGGRIFLPMHIPVMIAALFLPWTWSLAVGILTPVLSTLITGMPALTPIPMAIIMPLELATYAVLISLISHKLIDRKKWYAPLVAIVPAMVAGRVVAGLVMYLLQAIYLTVPIKPHIFVWGSITTGIPGIIIQIILIPILYHVIRKSIKS